MPHSKAKNPSIAIAKWVNMKYLSEKAVTSLKKKFSSAKPFKHIEIREFLVKDKVVALLKELASERFYEKESDLFRFHQTNDLRYLGGKTIREFIEFTYSDGFIEYMEEITGFRFKKGKADIFASLYQDTNVLLCHDDELEGRKIAFMEYLSTLLPSQGGNLELFSQRQDRPFRVAKKLAPKFNTFTFFEVSPISFHDVEEVTGEAQRIAVSGWYYEK